MMSEAKALHLAASAGLKVSDITTKVFNGQPASPNNPRDRVLRTLTVGRAVCSYDTAHGGAACWKVILDGVEHYGGFKGEAIATAVRLQKT